MSWCPEHDCPNSMCDEYQHATDLMRCTICYALVYRKNVQQHQEWHKKERLSIG